MSAISRSDESARSVDTSMVREEDLKIQNYINQNYPGAVMGGPILFPSNKAPPPEKKSDIIDEDGEILKIREIIKIKQK